MAITTKELGAIVEISKMEALACKKARVFEPMVQGSQVHELVEEARRCADEHLDHLRDLVRSD